MLGAVVLPGVCSEETSDVTYSRLHCDPVNHKFIFIEIVASQKIFVSWEGETSSVSSGLHPEP
jgi:hypothetical protein